MDRLYGRSEGNPLFAEELLASGGDGRGPLPPTLRDALMVRTERLPEAAQEMLRLLAVAQRADDALLAEAGDLSGAELRAALSEAVVSHLIVAGPDGMYRFRHALLREVVHDDLLPGEHAELHLMLAKALERRASEGPASAWVTAGMAHHYRSAGDQPAALRASVAAASAAGKVHAHGEAAALLERALEIWDRVPDAAELAGATHVDILVRAAAAQRSNVDDHRRAELLRKALSELDEQRDAHQVAGIMSELAGAQWSLGRGEDSRATLRHALSLLPRGGHERRARPAAEPPRLAPDAPGPLRRGARRRRRGARGGARDRRRRRLPARCSTASASRCSRSARRRPARPPSTRRSPAPATRGRRSTRRFVAANLADALHRAGRSREGLAVVIGAESGLPSGSRAARWLAMQRAEIEFGLGEWDAAESHLPSAARSRAPRAPTSTSPAPRCCSAAAIRAPRGRCSRTPRSCSALSLEPQFLAGCGALRGELERREGDLAKARAVVEEAIDRIEFCSEDGERLAEVACVGVMVEADAAERARDLGRRGGRAPRPDVARR